eukprot:225132_1
MTLRIVAEYITLTSSLVETFLDSFTIDLHSNLSHDHIRMARRNTFKPHKGKKKHRYLPKNKKHKLNKLQLLFLSTCIMMIGSLLDFMILHDPNTFARIPNTKLINKTAQKLKQTEHVEIPDLFKLNNQEFEIDYADVQYNEVDDMEDVMDEEIDEIISDYFYKYYDDMGKACIDGNCVHDYVTQEIHQLLTDAKLSNLMTRFMERIEMMSESLEVLRHEFMVENGLTEEDMAEYKYNDEIEPEQFDDVDYNIHPILT